MEVVRNLETLARSAQSYLCPQERRVKIVDARISCDPLHALEELRGRHPACILLCQTLAGLRTLGCPRQSQAFFVILTYLLVKRGWELNVEGEITRTILQSFGILEDTMIDTMRVDDRYTGGRHDDTDGPSSTDSWAHLTQSEFSFILLSVGPSLPARSFDGIRFRLKTLKRPVSAEFTRTLCLLGSIDDQYSSDMFEDTFAHDFEDFVEDSQLDAVFLSGHVSPIAESVLSKRSIPFYIVPAVMVEACAALADATLVTAFDLFVELRPSWLRCEVSPEASRSACYLLHRARGITTWAQSQPLLELDDLHHYEIHLSGSPSKVCTAYIQQPCEPLLRLQHAEVLDDLHSDSAITNTWLADVDEQLKQQPEIFDQVAPITQQLADLVHEEMKYDSTRTAVQRAVQLAGVLLQTSYLPTK